MVQRAFPPTPARDAPRRAPDAALASATVAFTTERIAYRRSAAAGIIVLITAIGVSILLQNIMAIVTHASPYFWQPVFVARRDGALPDRAVSSPTPTPSRSRRVRAHGVAAVCRLRTKMGMDAGGLAEQGRRRAHGLNVRRLHAQFILARARRVRRAAGFGLQSNGGVNRGHGASGDGLKVYAAVLGGIAASRARWLAGCAHGLFRFPLFAGRPIPPTIRLSEYLTCDAKRDSDTLYASLNLSCTPRSEGAARPHYSRRNSTRARAKVAETSATTPCNFARLRARSAVIRTRL